MLSIHGWYDEAGHWLAIFRVLFKELFYIQSVPKSISFCLVSIFWKFFILQLLSIIIFSPSIIQPSNLRMPETPNCLQRICQSIVVAEVLISIHTLKVIMKLEDSILRPNELLLILCMLK